MKPLVSVIVPTKNEEKLLSGCLKSLVNQQTNIPYEIIVVDTNSTDRTRQIAKQFKVKLILENRPGKARGVQTGALAAQGKYLAFTEADCRVNPHWIEAIYKNFKDNPKIVGLVSNYSFFDSNWLYQLLLSAWHPTAIWGYRLIYGNHSTRGTNMAIRKDIFTKIGGFKIEAVEMHDVEIGLRMAKLGPIKFVPEMKIQTSDRRIRGRLWDYFREAIPSTWAVLVKGQALNKQLYRDIR